MMDLETKLKYLINNIGVVVFQDYIDYRDDAWACRTSTYPSSEKHLDYTILEWKLIKLRPDWKPRDGVKEHDLRICDDGFADLVDVKCLLGYNYNVTNHKSKAYFQQGIDNFVLDHFAFYYQYCNGIKCTNEDKEPFKLGDVITFEFIKLIDAEDLVDKLQASSFKDTEGLHQWWIPGDKL